MIDTQQTADRPSVMTRFGGVVVRRRRAVILAWIALLIGTAVVGSSAFSVLSTDFGAGSSTESGRVAKQLDDLAGTGGQLAIVADQIDVDDPAGAAARSPPTSRGSPQSTG